MAKKKHCKNLLQQQKQKSTAHWTNLDWSEFILIYIGNISLNNKLIMKKKLKVLIFAIILAKKSSIKAKSIKLQFFKENIYYIFRNIYYIFWTLFFYDSHLFFINSTIFCCISIKKIFYIYFVNSGILLLLTIIIFGMIKELCWYMRG